MLLLKVDSTAQASESDIRILLDALQQAQVPSDNHIVAQWLKDRFKNLRISNWTNDQKKKFEVHVSVIARFLLDEKSEDINNTKLERAFYEINLDYDNKEITINDVVLAHHQPVPFLSEKDKFKAVSFRSFNTT